VDIDEDGTPDGCDSLIDSDADGVADSLDACNGHDDAVDVDEDGTPDGCDELVDSDADGVADSLDACNGHDDAVDVDEDGIVDGCDDNVVMPQTPDYTIQVRLGYAAQLNVTVHASGINESIPLMIEYTVDHEIMIEDEPERNLDSAVVKSLPPPINPTSTSPLSWTLTAGLASTAFASTFVYQMAIGSVRLQTTPEHSIVLRSKHLISRPTALLRRTTKSMPETPFFSSVFWPFFCCSACW
jgi:hypothetical protein